MTDKPASFNFIGISWIRDRIRKQFNYLNLLSFQQRNYLQIKYMVGMNNILV